MTDTSTPAAPEPPAPAPHHHPVIPRPQTDADALRAIDRVKSEMHERAEEIRRAPQDHQPKLVLSEHVRGTSLLDKIADAVNRICGSMWVFIGITLGIVVWLFLGNVVGFDKTPWPLLLTILNLPQLSIMISLQVSANRAQAASDRRALADHETLIALHAMATQQLDLLNGQTKVLAILDNFASKDMPGRQQQIQYTVNKILTAVSPAVSLARAIVAIRQLSARLSRRGYEDERERGGRRRRKRAERQRAAASRERPRQRRRGQGL